MKIRIKGNSVRFRLTKSEVETFCKTGYFQEATQFVNKKFIYALESKKEIDLLDASFENDKITIYLTEKEQKNWVASNRVGFKGAVTLSDGVTLQLLLEKDFACMDNVDEDQSDSYPNPRIK